MQWSFCITILLVKKEVLIYSFFCQKSFMPRNVVSFITWIIFCARSSSLKVSFSIWPRLCCTKYNTIQAFKHVKTMLRLETQRKEIYSYIRWYWNVGSIDASFYAIIICEYWLSVNRHNSIIKKIMFHFPVRIFQSHL